MSAKITPPDTLETERLLLRRPTMADAPAIFAYASDPEVTRHMLWPTHRGLADAKEFVGLSAESWSTGQEYCWVVTVKPDPTAVGCIGTRVRGHSADLGYVVDRGHWGQGIATEAARAVFAWVASLPGIMRIWATCDAKNARSIKLLEKCGFSREGTLINECVDHHGSLRDTLIYAITVKP